MTEERIAELGTLYLRELKADRGVTGRQRELLYIGFMAGLRVAAEERRVK